MACRHCRRRDDVLVGQEFEQIPKTGFHDLRHEAARLMLAQGVPLSTISDTLGHSGIGITSRIYAHVSEELRCEAANAMDAAFGEPAV